MGNRKLKVIEVASKYDLNSLVGGSMENCDANSHKIDRAKGRRKP